MDSRCREEFQTYKENDESSSCFGLTDFDKLFEIDCDVSKVSAYFSEKLNKVRQNYSTYDLELYAIIQALKIWQHYLIQKEFILNSEHEALRYLNFPKKAKSKICQVDSISTRIQFHIKTQGWFAKQSG